METPHEVKLILTTVPTGMSFVTVNVAVPYTTPVGGGGGGGGRTTVPTPSAAATPRPIGEPRPDAGSQPIVAGEPLLPTVQSVNAVLRAP